MPGVAQDCGPALRNGIGRIRDRLVILGPWTAGLGHAPNCSIAERRASASSVRIRLDTSARSGSGNPSGGRTVTPHDRGSLLVGGPVVPQPSAMGTQIGKILIGAYRLARLRVMSSRRHTAIPGILEQAQSRRDGHDGRRIMTERRDPGIDCALLQGDRRRRAGAKAGAILRSPGGTLRAQLRRPVRPTRE